MGEFPIPPVSILTVMERLGIFIRQVVRSGTFKYSIWLRVHRLLHQRNGTHLKPVGQQGLSLLTGGRTALIDSEN